MSLNRRHLLHAATAATVTGFWPALASSQPALKMAKVTVGFPPGDMADTLARTVADFLKGRYAETTLVDNKPGAAARIAIGSFAGITADPSEILFTPGAMVVLFPHVFKKLPYDPLKDLLPVTRIATTSFGLAVGPSVPAEVRTLAQWLQWCRQDAKNAVYATSGAGTGIHLTGEYLGRLSGTRLTMVPYKGAAPAAADLVGGQIHAQMATVASLIEYARAGKIRFLGVSSAQRVPSLPDVPTFAEQGYPKVVTDDFFGFFVRPGTPDEAVQALDREIQASLQDEKVRGILERMALTIQPSESPAAFRTLIEAEYLKWGGIVKTTEFDPMG
ncbi:MAG: twin-arginine translocation pathway signal protein [Burkholderiaceae bacterium]|nr:twin-arginine translocation pathway signal protein [Burkholderiaceae bacterium]